MAEAPQTRSESAAPWKTLRSGVTLIAIAHAVPRSCDP
jgi:hypothetical protein